jgi:hypothetical protein
VKINNEPVEALSDLFQGLAEEGLRTVRGWPRVFRRVRLVPGDEAVEPKEKRVTRR